MRSRAEDILQKAAASYLDRQGWRYCHVANERAILQRQLAATRVTDAAISVHQAL